MLRRWRAGWYLFGAQAVVVWGQPRYTTDIDITARIDPDDSAAFNLDMERAGFHLRVSDPQAFLARTRVIPYTHVATGVSLDLVLAGPGLEEQFIERAVPMEVEGVTIPVISAEDLVITKILAGRPKDIEDAWSVIEKQRPTLDTARIRATLAMLEEALAQNDLLPAFDAQFARADRSRRSL